MTGQSVTTPTETSHAVRPRLAVVDDDARIVRLLGSLLARSGFDVREFTSPEDALAFVCAGGVDAVVTDLSMPTLSGIELCRRVRSEVGASAPPFVLYSGDADGLSAQDRGLFAAVLRKPCRSEDVLGALHGLPRAEPSPDDRP